MQKEVRMQKKMSGLCSSILLMIMCVISLLFTTGMHVNAANEIYGNGSYGISININADPYVSFKSLPYGGYAYTRDGCAWFASARYNELTGTGRTIRAGTNWMRNASSLGLATGRDPQQYSLACFEWHVAVIEAVDGDNLIVSQGGDRNYPNNSYCSIKKENRASFEKGNKTTGNFLGYVYFSSKVVKGNGYSGNSSGPINNGVYYSDVHTEWTTSDNAYVIGTINNPNRINISKVRVGLFVHYKTAVEDRYNLVTYYEENCNRNLAKFNQWYNLKDEAGITLAGNKEYKFVFRAYHDDNTYWDSEPGYFKTQAVPITGVKLNQNTLNIEVGKFDSVQYSCLPNNDSIANDKVTWSCDNTNVASVEDYSGTLYHSCKITGLHNGTCTVTATTEDGGFTASCTVTVYGEQGKVQFDTLGSGDIGTETAAVGMQFIYSGLTIKEYGIYLQPQGGNRKKIKGGNTIQSGYGSVLGLKNLIAGTKYVYQWYVIDTDGKEYLSDSESFITKQVTNTQPSEPDKSDTEVPSEPLNHWEYANGSAYWYENGIKQGTSNDPQGVWYEGTNRGREIYDSASDAWYWLDSVYDGAKAVGKEVFMPYIYQNENTMSRAEMWQNANASDDGLQDYVYQCIANRTGKWVRYDENGKMLKGWVTISGTLARIYPDQVGNTYYYDNKTGLMAKGWITLNGRRYHFDETTGALMR